MRFFRFLTLIVSFALPCLVYAQSTDASLTGMVDDPSKAVIQGVSITAINTQTGVKTSTSTNGSGQYVLPNLIPGPYRVEVDKQGFKGIIEAGLILHVQDVVQMNFHMAVGSMSETVSVDASGLQMNTTDGSVSTVIDQQFVANIPLNGRSFQDLIELTPGVVTQSPQSQPLLGLNGDFSVNGQRTESNSYIVDGVSANTTAGYGGGGTAAPGVSGSLGASTALGTTQSLLSVDALQEFRVDSSTYSAEYGTTPGGQFSFLTRSGTSSFHGSLFEYLRNNFFDANDWFNDHYGIAEPALRQSDFGGTVGGPLVMPGQSRKQPATFFFFSYEGLRLDQPTEASLQYVPSDSLRTAASGLLQPILNAFPLPTGSEIQIACDNVTFQCPSGLAQGTLVSSGLAPFIRAYSLPSKIDSSSLRFDHTIGSKLHTFLRVGYTPSFTDTRYLSELTSSQSNLQTYTGGIDFQATTTVNDSFRIGYSRSVSKIAQQLDDFGGATPVNLGQALGAPGFAAYPAFALSFSGVGDTSLFTQNTGNYGRQWNASNTMNKTLGHHSFKLGVDYRRITSSYAPANPVAEFTFENPESVLINDAGYVNYGIARPAEPLYNQFALFFQDEWRITQNLNLTAGLRWEVEPPPQSGNAVKPYPLEGDLNNPDTLAVGAPGSPLYATTWHNFAPRLGMAWKASNTPGRETVVRGGVGIFYDTGQSAASYVFSDGLGVSNYLQASNIPVPLTPSDLALSFAVGPPYVNSVYADSRNFQLPYTIQWSAALEQGIGRDQNLTLSYVASNGRGLVQQTVFYGPPLNSDFTNALIVTQNGLTSNYQSLQVKFQRRLNRGLQILGSYTWSHSLDYGSEDNNSTFVRGNSDFDLRNNFNAAVTWEPHTDVSNNILKAILNSWGMDGRIFARSGFPVGLVGSEFENLETGTWGYSGLDIVPGTPVYTDSQLLPGGREINANAFQNPPSNGLGNAPRNFVRGFGEEQINLAIRRQFPITEKARLQFRAETFNILNHPNFGYIDPDLTDATFGQAIATLANGLRTVSPQYQQGGARSMQFALKLIF